MTSKKPDSKRLKCGFCDYRCGRWTYMFQHVKTRHPSQFNQMLRARGDA